MGRGFLCLLCASLLVSSLWGFQKLQSRMTNQDVIELVSLGFSDGVIIDKIRTAQGSEFDTSIPALKELQAARVSDAVIRAMISAQQNTTGSTLLVNPAGSSTGPLPIEIGVYIRVNGSLVEMEPEIVNWQTGGFVKTHATLGLVKGDLNGKISGAISPTQLSAPAVLVIRTAEGTSVTEYQLLHLHGKSNRREFRAVTGGVIHQSGGAERDTIHFEPRKIAERTWEISLGELTAGQYGFLPPGVYSSSISSSGKMYTFGIAQEKEHPAGTNARSSLDEAMEGPPAPPVEYGSQCVQLSPAKSIQLDRAGDCRSYHRNHRRDRHSQNEPWCPQGAGDSATIQDLSVMRSATDLYNTEHPQMPLTSSTTAANLLSALTLYSDVNGNTSATKTNTCIYGPYLKSIPNLPVGTNKNLNTLTTTGPAGTGTFAWYFDGTTFWLRTGHRCRCHQQSL